MTAWVGIIFITALGYGLVKLIGLKQSPLESVALGWLLGSFFVTSALFWWGWLGVWSIPWILAVLFAIWKVSRLKGRKRCQESEESELSDKTLTTENPLSFLSKGFIVFLWLLILTQFLYALFNVLWLPTQYFDTYLSWHLRAKYFMVERSLGLMDNPAWMLGAEKIHYPIHLPLLKALLCLLAGEWKDSWALGVDLINFTAFIVIVFFFVKRAFNTVAASIAVYLISSLPLLSIHLSAGFGDLTVAVYLASSIIFWERWRRKGDIKNLVVSGFLIACTAWTKNDAIILYYPVFFFATMIIGIAGLAGRWQALKVCTITMIFPLLPWLIFKMLTGLPYNPNPSPHLLEFHIEALRLSLNNLFAYGSFGILWILIIPFLFLRVKAVASRALWPFAWACLAMVLSVYMFTVNFRFLLTGTTFSRSLLHVVPLLIIAMVLRVKDILEAD